MHAHPAYFHWPTSAAAAAAHLWPPSGASAPPGAASLPGGHAPQTLPSPGSTPSRATPPGMPLGLSHHPHPHHLDPNMGLLQHNADLMGLPRLMGESMWRALSALLAIFCQLHIIWPFLILLILKKC